MHAAEARRELEARREAQDWARADRLGTPEAWQRYLGEWPEGLHAQEARRRLVAFMPTDPPAPATGAVVGHVVQLGAWSTEDAARAGLAASLERHPAKGVETLRALGWPDDICRAVLGHATHTGAPRDTLMARTLFACDELCGFLVACALVTPTKRLDEVKVSSVKKKMKRADFARNVNRDDIVNGTAELGADLDEHIAFTLEAMVGIREQLGL